MNSTSKAKGNHHTAPPKLDKNKPPSEADKRFYTAKVRALYAYGDHEAHVARPAPTLLPLSMPHGFARRRLNIQLSALKRGPLHGAFVDQLVNDVALEYILKWDEEEKDKWPPSSSEDEGKGKKKKTRTTTKKRPLRILEPKPESSEEEESPSPDEEEDDDISDYEPDDDDSGSWSGGS